MWPNWLIHRFDLQPHCDRHCCLELPWTWRPSVPDESQHGCDAAGARVYNTSAYTMSVSIVSNLNSPCSMYVSKCCSTSLCHARIECILTCKFAIPLMKPHQGIFPVFFATPWVWVPHSNPWDLVRLNLMWFLRDSNGPWVLSPINQSRCRTRVTSVGDFINESLICRPVLCFPD